MPNKSLVYKGVVPYYNMILQGNIKRKNIIGSKKWK